MINNQQTLRLLLPQWQGGSNPNYYFGAELLSHIVPVGKKAETIRVPVKNNLAENLPTQNGIEGEKELLQQFDDTMTILQDKQPDKVITLGGDCAVSQAPFAYLNEKYNGNLGVLWLDAHPDIATIDGSTNVHEMALGSLIGRGAPQFNKKMNTLIKTENVMFAGLKYEDLRPKDQDVNRLNLRYATPDDLANDSSVITNWLKENQIQQVAVHFDLDVLSPKDFRSIYPGEPHLKKFDAAVGSMTLQQVVRVLSDISANSEMVGLTIAEHMPWDAMNLHEALSKVDIFNE